MRARFRRARAAPCRTATGSARRLGHAVLHGIVVAVHDLAVDGFEHAFAVFRVDEVVEPVAVGFPE